MFSSHPDGSYSSSMQRVVSNFTPNSDNGRSREALVDLLHQSSSLYELCSSLLSSPDMSSEARFRRQFSIRVTRIVEEYLCCAASVPSSSGIRAAPSSWEVQDVIEACRSSVSVVEGQTELAEKVGAVSLHQPFAAAVSVPIVPPATSAAISNDAALASLASVWNSHSNGYHPSSSPAPLTVLQRSPAAAAIRRPIRYRVFRKRILDNLDDDSRSFVASHPFHSALLHRLPRRLSLREYSFRLLLLNYWWVRLFGDNLPFWSSLHLGYLLAAAPACALDLIQLETLNQTSQMAN